MSYPILEQLISYNRSYISLQPQGFVVHATDTPGASAQNEHDYFNSGNRNASVHYFTDWQSIIRAVPENEVVWGCGYTGNHKYIQMELCEPSGYDLNNFQQVWNRGVWLVADACVRYGWTTSNVFSHADISNMYGETNHQDPIFYFARYNKTMNDFKNDVVNMIKNLKGENNQVENLIVYFGDGDKEAAGLLSYKLQCPMILKAFASNYIPFAKHIYLIGGPNDIPSARYYSGSDRIQTAIHALTS